MCGALPTIRNALRGELALWIIYIVERDREDEGTQSRDAGVPRICNVESGDKAERVLHHQFAGPKEAHRREAGGGHDDHRNRSRAHVTHRSGRLAACVACTRRVLAFGRDR